MNQVLNMADASFSGVSAKPMRKDAAYVSENFRQCVAIYRGPDNKLAYVLADSNDQVVDLSKENQLIALLPSIYPEWLGGCAFNQVHNTKFAYVGGAMANGIATSDMVIALAKAGMIGFFGSAGLSIERVTSEIQKIKQALNAKNLPWGVNLIHTPEDIQLEQRLVDFYIRENVTKVSASAYMGLTPSVVRYCCAGLRKNNAGDIVRKNYLFPKISSPTVAKHFMSPAPETILMELLKNQLLTQEEVDLARQIPLAEDITVEADSGGHTDRQALTAIFPTILLLKNELCHHYQYRTDIRVGAAGGLGCPHSVASAFAMGAAYVLTGTVNQTCIESGLHREGKEMLASASVGDVVMTPSSDMFERGVKLQVLKRGTMYANRAAKLYQVYQQYESLEDIPTALANTIQQSILRQSFEAAWSATVEYWQQRDQAQIVKAEQDPKHKMALIFRAYLGQSSRWAINGTSERRADYQIWCGPAIAAFNAWIKGSYLEDLDQRSVVQVALNLLEGATRITRANQLRSFGISLPDQLVNTSPRPLEYSINN